MSEPFSKTWPGSAVSIESLPGNGGYRFSVPDTVRGVAIGVTTNTASDNTSSIEHGIYCERGEYRVLSNGVLLTTPVAHTSSNIFDLRRVGDTFCLFIDDEEVYTFGNKNSQTVYLRAFLYKPGDAVTNYEVYYSVSFSGGSEGGFSLRTIASNYDYSFSDGEFDLHINSSEYKRGQVEGDFGLSVTASEGGFSYSTGVFSLVASAEGGFADDFSYSVGSFLLSTSATGRPPNKVAGVLDLVTWSAYSGYGLSSGEFNLSVQSDGQIRPDNYLYLAIPTLQFEADIVTSDIKNYVFTDTETQSVYSRSIQEWFAVATNILVGRGVEPTLSALAALESFTFYNPEHDQQDTIQAAIRAETAIRVALTLTCDIFDQEKHKESFMLWLAANLSTSEQSIRHRFVDEWLLSAIRSLDPLAAPGVNVSDVVDTLSRLSLNQKAVLLDDVLVELVPKYSGIVFVDQTLSLGVQDASEQIRSRVAAISDIVDTFVLLRLEDELVCGWVMNVDGQNPVSQYTEYNFNSFCKVGTTYFGASDQGLYTLGGDTDDGEDINSSVKTMMLDFGVPYMKRIESAYVGYKADGKLLLKIRSVDNGQLVENWYEGAGLTADAPREGYCPVGRGMRSRYWQVELTNVDGSDFELDKLELHPITLSRRV